MLFYNLSLNITYKTILSYENCFIKYQQIKQVMMKNQETLMKNTFYILALSLGFIPSITTHATNSFHSASTNIQTNNQNSPTKQTDTMLVIDIAPTLCQLSNDYANFRQCADGKNYIIRSLVFTNQAPCQVNTLPKLSPLQKITVQQFMPDKTMQTQAWQNHGACSGLITRDYFRKIIQQGNKLKLKNEFNNINNKNYQITQYQLRKNILSHNKQLANKEIQFLCHTEQKGNRKIQLLTQIRICDSASQCHTNRIDKDDKYAQYTTKCTEPLLTIVKP